MSNLAKLNISALDAFGKNYLSWALYAKIYLKSKDLLKTIEPSETTTDEKKAKAMVFLRHHLHDGLKDEYITKEDPADLWQCLKDRFDHQKYVILPKAKHEWLNLRFQDYKTVSEYNSAMFRITSKMILCGENISDYDMIEKTFQTFHPINVVLQQQYRTRNYTRYSDLMQVLQVAEQNNELVMMNHQTRPTGSAPLPEVNVASSSFNNWQGRGRGRARGRDGGRGRGRSSHLDNFNAGKSNKNFHVNDGSRVVKKQSENVCYKCGMKGHWYQTCRIPKHLTDLYQASQKEKDAEANLISDEPGPSFHGLEDDYSLDIADFLVDNGNEK